MTRVVVGETCEAMAAMPACSVDAIVTDPPYGLEFMGKEWDRLARMQEWHEAWAREALRVLKPGGHLLAFGGTRTSHRLVCGLEDAGFEIRDSIVWLYGTGFPKSLNVSKAIDKAAGAQREVVGPARYAGRESSADLGVLNDDAWEGGAPRLQTAPATEQAAAWDGWGTALKPAHEPIVVARKPLVGTVAANVLAHGTGALNIDACRIGWGQDGDRSAERRAKGYSEAATKAMGAVVAAESATSFSGEVVGSDASRGRWPANVILDEEAAAMLDEQTGVLANARNTPESRGGAPQPESSVFGIGFAGPSVVYDDRGGASRFFYCAKPSPTERNRGLPDGTRNPHPTVKPVALMRWLIRLTTPEGATVLDPFMGSGTTGIAARLEHRAFIGIDRDHDYVTVARARIAAAA